MLLRENLTKRIHTRRVSWAFVILDLERLLVVSSRWIQKNNLNRSSLTGRYSSRDANDEDKYVHTYRYIYIYTSYKIYLL